MFIKYHKKDVELKKEEKSLKLKKKIYITIYSIYIMYINYIEDHVHQIS